MAFLVCQKCISNNAVLTQGKHITKLQSNKRMKSIFKIRPEDLQKKNASFKEFAKFLTIGMRKIAQLHNSPETAVPFCLHLKHKYNGDTEEEKKMGNILFALNNASKWQDYLKKVDKKEYIAGTCFLAVDEKGQPEKLVLQVSKGKAKSIDIQKKLRRPIKKKFNHLSIEVIRKIAKNGSTAVIQSKVKSHGGSSTDLKSKRAAIEALVNGPLKGLKGEIDDLKKIEAFQNLAEDFKKQLLENKNAGIQARFASFLNQIERWEKELADILKIQGGETKLEESLPSGLSAQYSEIKRLVTQDLKNFTAFQQGGNIPSDMIQKALKLGRIINVFEHEYAQSPVDKQQKMKKEQSDVLTIRKAVLENLKKVDKKELRKASASLNQQKVQEITAIKKAIQSEYQLIDLKGGLKAGSIPRAQKLRVHIRNFKQQLKEVSEKARQPFMSFFQKVKELDSLLVKALKKADHQEKNTKTVPVAVQQIVEEQAKVFAEVEALVNELNIFNLKL